MNEFEPTPFVNFQEGDYYRSALLFDNRPAYQAKAIAEGWVWLKKVSDFGGDWPGVVIKIKGEGHLWERVIRDQAGRFQKANDPVS